MERRRAVDFCRHAGGLSQAHARCETSRPQLRTWVPFKIDLRRGIEAVEHQIDVGAGEQGRGYIEGQRYSQLAFSIHCNFDSLSR